MPKGNKGGVTKDDERYGDNSQPKHENSYGYASSAPPASQGNRNSQGPWDLPSENSGSYPKSAVSGGGESVHERTSNGTPIDSYDHNDTHRAPDSGSDD